MAQGRSTRSWSAAVYSVPECLLSYLNCDPWDGCNDIIQEGLDEWYVDFAHRAEECNRRATHSAVQGPSTGCMQVEGGLSPLGSQDVPLSLPSLSLYDNRRCAAQ